jgi:hypothetical protein
LLIFIAAINSEKVRSLPSCGSTAKEVTRVERRDTFGFSPTSPDICRPVLQDLQEKRNRELDAIRW